MIAAVLTAAEHCLALCRRCSACSMQITQELREYAQKHDFDEEQAMQVETCDAPVSRIAKGGHPQGWQERVWLQAHMLLTTIPSSLFTACKSILHPEA